MQNTDSLTGQLQTSFRELREDLTPKRLLAVLPTGLMNGLTATLVAVSLSSLVFSTALPGHVPQGVALGLASVVLGSLVMVLLSSYPSTIYVIQDGPAAILALTANAIVLQLAGAPEMQFPSVLAALAISSLLTGLLYLALGVFRLGNLIRYIPYPVIGGFLAGTGWLLFKGSLDLMTHRTLGLADLPTLLMPETLVAWLPPFGLAVALLLVLRRYSNPYLLTAFSLAIVAGFYIILAVSGISIQEAGASGWLTGGMAATASWQPLTPASLPQVHWPVVLGQLPNLLTASFTSLVALLLAASGLEVSVKRPVSLNQELKASGVANILSGAFSGSIGYQAISLSVMGQRIGIHSRVFPLLTGLVALAFLAFGLSVLQYFPLPLLGFLLFFLGLSFLSEWLILGWKRLARSDYAIVVLIVVVIASRGFLEGVILGLLVSLVLFVISYSQVNVISRALDGQNYASRMDRRPEHQQLLYELGKHILVLQLRGFIFFGTANSIQVRVQERLTDTSQPRLQFLVLDFRQVSRFDSSAINSFVMMRTRAETDGFQLVFSNLRPEQQAQLRREGFVEKGPGSARFFGKLDEAIEWCEESLLQQNDRGSTQRLRKLEEVLAELLPKEVNVRKLASYFERQEIPEAQTLIEQGTPPRGLYLLESGRVRVVMHQLDGSELWLRSMEAGVIFGEMQVYSGREATATVETAGPTVVQYLSRERLQEMEKKDPPLAIAFHRLIANVIGARLLQQNSVVAGLRED